MREMIGLTAGRIWSLLNEKGSSTMLKMKSSLGISNSLLCLALGWLSKEDKIELSESGHNLVATLKQS
jgi:hypothetical protein